MTFHESIFRALDSFRYALAANVSLLVSIKQGQEPLRDLDRVLDLPYSVEGCEKRVVHVGKDIVEKVALDSINGPAPFFSTITTDLYCIFTIAIKDILWEEPDFELHLESPEMQFLYNLRNAAAHHGKFKFNDQTLKKLPVTWKGRTITKELEGKSPYDNFLKPGDLFVLLEDISNLVKQKISCEIMLFVAQS